MIRLALAAFVLVALVGGLALVATAFERSVAGLDSGNGSKLMQRAAYFVLIALMLYVSIVGVFA